MRGPLVHGLRFHTFAMLDRLASAKSVRRLALLSMGAIAVAAVTYTRADPDLWGHVRFGADIVNARSVHLADRYSFSSDRAWTNHEWLAEVLMYGAYRVAGGAGLIALKLLLVVAMLAGVAMALRKDAIPLTTRLALIALALVATMPQTAHVRPQLFSLALFAWLLVLLGRARDAKTVPLLSMPLFAVWANLHGGWIVGAGVLASWCAAGALTRPSSGRQSLAAAVVVACAVVATLCNPFGFGLWSFLRDTVGFGRVDIVDWQPIYRLGATYVLLWAMTAAVLVAAIASAIAQPSADVQALAIPLALALAAFRVNRLQAFFALATIILAAPAIRWRRHAPAPDHRPLEPFWKHAIALILFAIVTVGAANVGAANATCVRVDDAFSPRPGVVDFIERQGLHGRLLTWFDWGQYAIWHLADRGIEVSIDGRRETVYSDAVVREHLQFYFDPAARDAVLARLQPDYVWLPSALEATSWLTSHGWQPVFVDERSVLFARGAAPPITMSTGVPLHAPRCFPEP